MLLGRVGFDDVVVKERFDCFRETSKERVAKKYAKADTWFGIEHFEPAEV